MRLLAWFALLGVMVVGGVESGEALGMRAEAESSDGWVVVGVEEFAERLAQLPTGGADAYFDLAEEIGYSATTAEGVRLASEMTLVSWLLRDGDGRARHERSVLLLLADLADTASDRGRLLGLAGVRALDESGVLSGDEQALLDMLSSIRRGDWSRMREIVRAVDVGQVMRDAGASDTASGVVESLVATHRDRRTERRTVRVRREQGIGSTLQINPANDGDVSPVLSSGQLEAMLRVEAVVLRVKSEELVAGVWLTGDEPVRLDSLESLSERMGLDPERAGLEASDGGWRWVRTKTANQG